MTSLLQNLILPYSLKNYRMPFSKSELYFEFQKLKWTSETTKHIPCLLLPTKYNFAKITFLLRSCLLCQVFARTNFYCQFRNHYKSSSIMKTLTQHNLSHSDVNGTSIIHWTQHHPLAQRAWFCSIVVLCPPYIRCNACGSFQYYLTIGCPPGNVMHSHLWWHADMC